jgi:hypothetical protein
VTFTLDLPGYVADESTVTLSDAPFTIGVHEKPSWQPFHEVLEINEQCTAAHVSSGYEFCVSAPQRIATLASARVRVEKIATTASGVARHLPEANGEILTSKLGLGFDWEAFVGNTGTIPVGQQQSASNGHAIAQNEHAPVHVGITILVPEEVTGDLIECGWTYDFRTGTVSAKPALGPKPVATAAEFETEPAGPVVQIFTWSEWGSMSSYKIEGIRITIDGEKQPIGK